VCGEHRQHLFAGRVDEVEPVGGHRWRG
jgi:hypothetical protein